MINILSKLGIRGGGERPLLDRDAKTKWSRKNVWSTLGGRSQDAAERPGERGLTPREPCFQEVGTVRHFMDRVTPMAVPGDPEQSRLVHGSLPYVLLPIMLFLVCLRIASQFPFKNKAKQPTNEQVIEKGRAC